MENSEVALEKNFTNMKNMHLISLKNPSTPQTTLEWSKAEASEFIVILNSVKWILQSHKANLIKFLLRLEDGVYILSIVK